MVVGTTRYDGESTCDERLGQCLGILLYLCLILFIFGLQRLAEGNGLGLALVRRVIELTDSEISVESEPGRGTAFTVKIKKASHG